jgi:PAS domain S-box-containing protein
VPKLSRRKNPGQHDLFLDALAEAYKLQEFIISTTEISIISTNTEGIITSFNKAAERLTGYTSREMVNKSSPLVLHDNMQLIQRASELSRELEYEVEPDIEVLTTVTRLGKISERREWIYIHKDGRRIPVLLSVSGLLDDREVPIGYSFIALDITEQKKSEDELIRSKQNLEALAVNLQEQNRQLDEFAHIISHNLRSPIGNIKALIGLLDSNSSLADYQQIFEKLKNVSNNLGETMNELMETIKVKKEAGVQRTEIRFKEIFDKVVQSLEGDLIQCEAQLTFDFTQAPTIHHSKPYLESIFQNLLSNAIKYRSPERKPLIHASTYTGNDKIGLQISDNGQGIDMIRFGDKLFGLHKTFHEHKDAKGVGLFLVKTQVEALGGSIHATSEPGIGTTFRVTF